MKFKNYVQHYMMDCGPTCIKMIANYYGKKISLHYLREKTKISKYGVSLFGIKEVATELGFETSGVLLSYDELLDDIQLPAIAHWRQNHFVVIYKIKKEKIFISDPADGNKVYKKSEFLNQWESYKSGNQNKGAILLLNPTEKFYSIEESGAADDKINLRFIFRYLAQHKSDLIYLLIAIGISSILQFIFPFLTQLIVDSGINGRSTNIVAVILLAQFGLLLGRLFIEYTRGWLLLYINSRLNISILSDFLVKLLKLPISFFDTKMSGDILQRINDHRRVQDFLSGPALEITFSIVTIVVLSITLSIYSLKIFFLFLFSSIIYVIWTFYLLKRRRKLDYKRFEFSSESQNEIIQMINGIQEIKLNNSEDTKRWDWEKIQSKLFYLNIDSLKYSQMQQSGSFLLNEGKNLIITFIAAASVINGEFTLGMMLAIQAIVGQLNGPIALLISLFQNYQDTKLSIERLNEIHRVGNEETSQTPLLRSYGTEKYIKVNKLNFCYPGALENVLLNVDFTIPYGKTTAIVGASGSGKTTLLKLLLKFYESYEGVIFLGDRNLKEISHKFWRSKCGTVLQDGFIFSDTIANNIAIGQDSIDDSRLNYAIKLANIDDFIKSLPLNVKTKIGAEGMGISEGQKQRLLIARAIYKNPDYLFFDEATNALDANNESVITKNLTGFFKDRTVVIVAHRLSTVKNADQIIVLDKGKVVEQGNHKSLVELKGAYFTLVKNQLELGN